ncbi:MAG: hypothetical protein ABFS38_15350 [Bacteroidota bacterium]
MATSAEMNPEEYRLLTDRSIYIAGELLNFRVFNLSPDSLQELGWSKVYYAELISPEGLSHAQAKISMDSTGAGGALKIPGELPSGTYYLKGYTRWMRNYGPTSYTYLSVEVVNPYKRTLLSVDTSSKVNLPLMKPETDPETAGLIMGDLSGRVVKKAPVILNLSLNRDDSPAHCCVTVIPDGVLKKQWESVQSPKDLRRKGIELIPETRGVSLSGKVEFPGSGDPAPYAVVYISIMDKEKSFNCNYADSSGRFYFSCPDSYGERDLFISANHPDAMGLDLFIDQDFCPEPITLPSYPLEIEENDLQLIADLSLNAQIRDHYYSGHSASDEPGSTHMKFFYGDPSSVVKFNDFIKLPTLEEYFTEVTPQVSLKKSNRTRKFRVWGDHPELEFLEPLVMIDGVAIFDVESVLEISPGYIDRIEIVDAPYIKGSVTFGGIINIVSRNNDMGFIDLPASGTLLNYKMYAETLPGDQDHQSGDPEYPDVRNTIYWNPYVELSPGENRELSFLAPEVPGFYQLLIRGYDATGIYLEKSIPFRVE